MTLNHEVDTTYEGMPTAMAKAARIVSPLPYPRALYSAGAKSGNPKPARERRNATAAKARMKVRVS